MPAAPVLAADKKAKKENHSLRTPKSFQDQPSVEKGALIDPVCKDDLEEDSGIYIRDSTSAPLDTPSRQRPDSKALDEFRPDGYQKPAAKRDTQYLLNEVNQEVHVAANEPLALFDSRPSSKDEDDIITKQMWEEAVRDLSEDNKRRRFRPPQRWQRQRPPKPAAIGDQQQQNFDMSDVFCLCPCCCCCFCLCRRPKQTQS